MAKSDGIEAGKLDRRIILQSRSDTRDAQGGSVDSYATYSTVWAHMRPIRGDERLAAGVVAGTRQYTFRARFQHATKPTDRILFPLLSLTDLATVGPFTTITSVTGGFTAYMVGMLLVVTAGTKWATGDYRILTHTDTNTIAVQKAAAVEGAAAGTGIVARAFYLEDVINVNEAGVVMEMHCTERVG
jgi:SPP1 family predicted phage head-tail adaptor